MLQWMPYCLLLSNGYRIGERSDFVYSPQTSLLYVKTGEIIASEILFAKNGDSVMRFVFSKTKKGMKGLFFQFVKCQ